MDESFFKHIPRRLTQYLCSYLHFTDICRLKRTCKYFSFLHVKLHRELNAELFHAVKTAEDFDFCQFIFKNDHKIWFSALPNGILPKCLPHTFLSNPYIIVDDVKCVHKIIEYLNANIDMEEKYKFRSCLKVYGMPVMECEVKTGVYATGKLLFIEKKYMKCLEDRHNYIYYNGQTTETFKHV
jgi:hypothetical protein